MQYFSVKKLVIPVMSLVRWKEKFCCGDSQVTMWILLDAQEQKLSASAEAVKLEMLPEPCTNEL